MVDSDVIQEQSRHDYSPLDHKGEPFPTTSHANQYCMHSWWVTVYNRYYTNKYRVKPLLSIPISYITLPGGTNRLASAADRIS